MSDARRCWAPAPWRPHAPHQQVREFINAFVAVSPFDGSLTTLLCRDVDALVMSAFLTQVAVQYPRDFCIVVLDGAGWHVARDLVVPPAMHLEWLPPYSPELNPVEPIWDWIRDHYTGNRAFASLGAVEATLGRAFRDLASRPTRVRSMTLFDWISILSL